LAQAIVCQAAIVFTSGVFVEHRATDLTAHNNAEYSQIRRAIFMRSCGNGI
jgi:hypothetical protein